MSQTQTIPDGFGARLREERERLGLSQTALADFGGVKRLAQSQYEKETSSPPVRYLTAIAKSGVDLQYVLFGRRPETDSISPTERCRIESEAFTLLEDFVRQQPDGTMGAEGRFALFQLFRNNLYQQHSGRTPAAFGLFKNGNGSTARGH